MKDHCEVFLVPADASGGFFDLVSSLLEGKALPFPTFFTLEDIFERLRRDTMQLWLAFEEGEEPFAFMVTERIVHPLGVTINIFLFGGSRVRRCLTRLHTLELWAQMQGASGIEFRTRPQLAKLLSSRGYQCAQVACYKPLKVMH